MYLHRIRLYIVSIIIEFNFQARPLFNLVQGKVYIGTSEDSIVASLVSKTKNLAVSYFIFPCSLYLQSTYYYYNKIIFLLFKEIMAPLIVFVYTRLLYYYMSAF